MIKGSDVKVYQLIKGSDVTVQQLIKGSDVTLQSAALKKDRSNSADLWK